MSRASLFRVVASSLGFAIVSSAGAQTLAPAGENRLQPAGVNRVQLSTSGAFNVFGDGSEHMRKMRERLQDPQQRAALREEQRGYIVESNYDLAEVLELDATTYDKLIELQTDQQMSRLEEFHLRGFSRTLTPDIGSNLQSHAERQNQEIASLRELLGQEKLERYQTFQRTHGERRMVREFDDYLQTSDKLNRTQKERLIELFRAHFDSTIRNHHSMTRSRRSKLGVVMRDLPSQEEMQRQSQLMTIETNEDIWRRTPAADRQLRDQAAAFLTAPQLAALEQMHADKLQRLQQSIEQMRVQAGLSPTIPAEAEAAEPTPAKVARDVRVRIKIAVNRGKPASFTQVVSSGTTMTFEVDEGLLVQATPIVYDNDTYQLQFEYFEQGATGKRLIGNMGSMGTLERVPQVADAPMGGSGSIVSGSKAYSVELNSSVEAI
jgi:hypothetical protein